jgi:hypothetical protein
VAFGTRRPRPLRRDTATLRDDRLFIVACDDTYAPKQYFDFFRLTRIQVHVIPTEDGTSAARHVLERLKAVEHEEDDELWLLLDVDHCAEPNHIGAFTNVLADARRSGINIALSKPNFELWLLLHHGAEAEVQALANAAEVEEKLRQTLGTYNKTALKPEHFPLSSVIKACERAQRLDQSMPPSDLPERNTSRVHLLWRAMVAKALPSQLPVELRNLLQANR